METNSDKQPPPADDAAKGDQESVPPDEENSKRFAPGDSHEEPLTGNPITDAVIQSTRGYGNTGYSPRGPMTVIDGELYIVSFTGGKDKRYHDRWVYKRGQHLGVYTGLQELLLDRRTGLASPPPSQWTAESIKLLGVLVLTVVLIIPVIYLAITQPDSKGLSVLVGLVGLLIGYIVGNKTSE